jgi:hypothetical protein
MLTISIEGREDHEVWDPNKEEFTIVRGVKPTTLTMEHSLLSLSKWESKYHKPFLGKDEKTPEEMLYYIQCMTINNVDPEAFYCLTQEQIQQIGDYIADPMTATTINHRNGGKGGPRRNNRIVTSEVIYYWMVAHQIPFECQKWHLNRLLMLIEVCNVENAPQQKMSNREILKQNRALNMARRAKMHSSG